MPSIKHSFNLIIHSTPWLWCSFSEHKGIMDTHTYFLECVWHKGYCPEQYLQKELGTQHLTRILTNFCAWRFPGLPMSPSKSSWDAYSRMWLWWYHSSHLLGKTLPGCHPTSSFSHYFIYKEQILPLQRATITFFWSHISILSMSPWRPTPLECIS